MKWLNFIAITGSIFRRYIQILIAVEVFEGNTSDFLTLVFQIHRVRTTFGIERAVFVGDRGMIMQAWIRDEF